MIAMYPRYLRSVNIFISKLQVGAYSIAKNSGQGDLISNFSIVLLTWLQKRGNG